MNENIKNCSLNFNLKKALFILLVFFLVGYILYDVSLKTVNNLRTQGYYTAINETIIQAEGEDCQPFRVFLGEKSVDLINVNCLQEEAEEGAIIEW